MFLGFPAAPSQKEVGGSPGPHLAPFGAHFATSTGFAGQALASRTLVFASGAWVQMFMEEPRPDPEDGRAGEGVWLCSSEPRKSSAVCSTLALWGGLG